MHSRGDAGDDEDDNNGSTDLDYDNDDDQWHEKKVKS